MEKKRPNVTKQAFYVCHIKGCKEKDTVFESVTETKQHFKKYHKGVLMVL